MSALILVVVGIVAGALIVGVLATALLWSWHRRKRALPAPTPVPLLNAPAPRFGIGGFSLGDVVLFDQTETWLTAALRIQDAGNEEATLFFSERSADNDVLLLRLRPELTTFRVHPISLPGAGVSLSPFWPMTMYPPMPQVRLTMTSVPLARMRLTPSR